MEELVFTPAAVLDLLSQIDELKDLDVGISETPDGIQVQIGDSIYMISDNNFQDIEVSEEVVEEISDLNDTTYDEISSDNVISDETVESGIIKEIAKTLLVGGVARLVKKFLTE